MKENFGTRKILLPIKIQRLARVLAASTESDSTPEKESWQLSEAFPLRINSFQFGNKQNT